MMTTADAPRPRDKWIPLYFVAFFLVILCVDTVFVTVAFRTHTGSVTERPYEEGLAYNDVLQNDNAQNALGWNAAIQYAPGDLSVQLTDKGGSPLAGADVHAKITRPVDSRYDYTTALKERDPGVYHVQTTLPLPGLWHVRIFSKWNGQAYQQGKTLIVERR